MRSMFHKSDIDGLRQFEDNKPIGKSQITDSDQELEGAFKNVVNRNEKLVSRASIAGLRKSIWEKNKDVIHEEKCRETNTVGKTDLKEDLNEDKKTGKF